MPDETQTVPLDQFAARFYVPMVKNAVFSFKGVFVILAVLFTIAVITGSSNAVNLTDGLDGLAAGCLIMAASALAFIAFVSNNIDLAGYLNIAYIEGSGEIAIYLCAFVGACLGFLLRNDTPCTGLYGGYRFIDIGWNPRCFCCSSEKKLLLAIVGGIL